MITDDDVEALVRERLHAELASELPGSDLVHRIHRRVARRRQMVRAGLALAIVAIGAPVLAVEAGAPPTHRAPVVATPTVPRIRTALTDSVSTQVLHMSVNAGEPGETDLWTHGTTSRWTSTAAKTQVATTVHGDTQTTLVVDAANRTWATSSSPVQAVLLPKTIAPVPPLCGVIFGVGANLRSIADIEAVLTGGGLVRQPGTVTVSGQSAIVFQQTCGDHNEVGLTAYLNADTLLPIRIVTAQGTGTTTTIDFTFLPPTGGNIARTRASVPPGFARVPISEEPGG